jgi:hypothetical protein
LAELILHHLVLFKDWLDLKALVKVLPFLNYAAKAAKRLAKLMLDLCAIMDISDFNLEETFDLTAWMCIIIFILHNYNIYFSHELLVYSALTLESCVGSRWSDYLQVNDARGCMRASPKA